MINSLCGSMGSLKSEVGSLKSEHSCPELLHQQPSSPPNDATDESDNMMMMKKKAVLPAHVVSSADLEQNSLTPASLNFSALKFEVLDGGGDMEIQSPDWESLLFPDQLEGDFMISSPVRNLPSPSQSTGCNYNNYNYVHGSLMHGHMGGAFGTCSPPRSSSPLGPYNSSKAKGMSPLQRVFSNSPNNQFMQVETLSLPALESFLDDYDHHEGDDDFLSYSNAIKSAAATAGSGNSSLESYDSLTTVPALLDCLTLPNNSSRFCGGQVSDTTSSAQVGSQLSQDQSSDDMFQMGSISSAPLLEQLQHERQQEKQQQRLQRQHARQQQSPLGPQQPSPGSQNINQRHLMVPAPVGPEEHDSGLQLVHLLLACAEAVAKEDYMLARKYLHHLNSVVTPFGDSMQRVAACFTEALSARLEATLTKPSSSSTPKTPFTPFPPNSLEILKIYQIVYQACPYIKFAHFTANQAIFEAFEAEERVHVIDLDILQGYQWPAFMQALAARPGGPPFLRITGVGTSPEAVKETGRCLRELAYSLRVPFEFHPVGEQLEDLEPHMFNRKVGEALAVNSVNRLHRVPGNCLGNLLSMIRDQAPNIVTIVEQEASHNGPYFLGRFLEALHYYSAIFDSLDATFPTNSPQRSKVEQFIFAPEIRNIVSCEGSERVMRHERLEKWRKIMEGKGFKGVALSGNAVTQSKILLSLYLCDGYRLTEDKGCLLLGWQDRSILAASAWRC